MPPSIIGRRNVIIVLSTFIILSGIVGIGIILDLTRERVILATTTSTRDTGLLDYIIPRFERGHQVKVDVIALGTGQAIETAKRGDADLVLIHSKTAEEAFINGGDGVHRVGVMYNDFIIVGPSSDPAGIRGVNNASEAFKRIYDAGVWGKATFISRGDNSGTHLKEKSIWSKAGLTPSGSWYLEVGRGMGDVLIMTSEKRGYTLSDRGTWLSSKSRLNLQVISEKDEFLLNPYALILVNPEKHPNVNYEMALAIAKFMISQEGQQLVEDFKVEGQTLFIPVARNYDLAKSLGFPDQEQEVAWYDSQR